MTKLSFLKKLREPDEMRALADRGMDFALVASRFNEAVVDRLAEGAAAVLVGRGAQLSNIELIRVPGAFELPAAARLCVESRSFDAVIALGCVIRGQTPHFDYVAGECARGIAELARSSDIPVIFGVLTADDAQQAEDRSVILDDWEESERQPHGTAGNAERGRTNKGAEAAIAALEMIEVFDEWLDDDDDEDD